MKRLLEFPALMALGFLSLLSQEVSADITTNCTVTGPGQINGANPGHQARFGSWINVWTKTSGDAGTNCQSYRTAIDDWSTKLLSEETSESEFGKVEDEKIYNAGTPNEYTLNMHAIASADASIASGSVTSRVRKYNATAYVSSKPEWIDLVKIENLTAGPTDVNYIPVTYCSELTSEFTTNGVDSTVLAYGDYGQHTPLGYDHPAGDSLTITGGNQIVHTQNGKVCRTGEIKMTGQYAYFTLRLEAYTLGNPGVDTVPTFGIYTTNVPVNEGSLTATFDMGALPAGATCESASGVFPGCDRVCKDDGLSKIAAPTQIDYSDGLFSLTRKHQHNGICEPSDCGVNWHGSYNRLADFLLTSESNTVALTDSSGSQTLFRENDPGVWEAVDEYTEDTFEEVLDGSQTLIGYLHTNAAGVKDTYDLTGVLTKIEHPTGEILDITYDGSDRLSAVTDSVSGDNLTFTYNANDQVTLVSAPTDTISYTYDANDNLKTAVNALGTTTYDYNDPTDVNALTLISHSSGTSTAVSNTSSFQDIINVMHKILFPNNTAPTPDGFIVGLPDRVVNGDYLKIVNLADPKKGATYFERYNPPGVTATAYFSHMGIDDQYHLPQLSCEFPSTGILQYEENTKEPDLNSPNRMIDKSNIRAYGIYDLFETFAHELWHLSKGTPIDIPGWPNSPGPSQYSYELSTPVLVTAATEATERDAYMKGRELLIKYQDTIKDKLCTKTCYLGICY